MHGGDGGGGGSTCNTCKSGGEQIKGENAALQATGSSSLLLQMGPQA